MEINIPVTKEKDIIQYSVSPSGEKFTLPLSSDYSEELMRLEKLALYHKTLGREIVIVMGLGFVGAIMAAVIADAEDKQGYPSKFVIGIQRPSVRSFWKVRLINKGIPPFKTEDPRVEQIIRTTVLEKKTFIATYTEEALKFADVVVIDIQCDYVKKSLGKVEDGYVDMEDLKAALHAVGRHAPFDALILIETTVPPGTTEYIAYPIIKKEFTKRILDSKSQSTFAPEPLLAHSYERVMPGREYVNSIRNFWRVCSGINSAARERIVKFLNEVINTRDFPLTVMDRPIESETAKIVENSYRATILAFMDEWSRFAEEQGVDLTKIIKAIKVRPTHNNIMFPGPGIGGYCLPKDGALGAWAYRNILGGKKNILKITTQAININDTRALHVVDLLFEALNITLNINQKTEPFPLKGIIVALLGASYREDVGDTRNSGSEIILRKLVELGADVRVHDPYVENWSELEANNGKSIFFKNQDNVSKIKIERNLDIVLRGVDAIILAVRHQQYLDLFPDAVVSKVKDNQPDNTNLYKDNILENNIHKRTSKLIIVDCFGILTDSKIKRYMELGCLVRGLGRGHISKFLL